MISDATSCNHGLYRAIIPSLRVLITGFYCPQDVDFECPFLGEQFMGPSRRERDGSGENQATTCMPSIVLQIDTTVRHHEGTQNVVE